MSDFYMLERTFYWDPDFDEEDYGVLHMYTYLGASKFCNLIGLYQRSFRNVCADSKMPPPKAQKAIDRLQVMDKIHWDADNSLVWVKGYLKRTLCRWSDTTFKGVLSKVLDLNPKLEIVKKFSERYQESLLAYEPQKKYKPEDKERLFAFFKKLDDPSIPHTDPMDGPSMGSNSLVLSSSSLSVGEEKESIAKAGPTPRQESLPVDTRTPEEILLAYWRKRITSKYGQSTPTDQTLANIRALLHPRAGVQAVDFRDLVAAVAQYATTMDARFETAKDGKIFPYKGTNFFGRAGYYKDFLPKPGEQAEMRSRAEAAIATMRAEVPA